MKTKKMVVIIGLIVLSMLVLWGLGFVQAWGPVGFIGRGSHPKFHGMGCRPGLSFKHLPEQILTLLDFKIGVLELSEIQKEKYGVIRSEFKSRLTEGIESRKVLFDDLRAKFNQPDPNIHAVAELIKNRMNDVLGFMEKNIGDFVRFYEMLDDNQKNRVFEKLRGHFEMG